MLNICRYVLRRCIFAVQGRGRSDEDRQGNVGTGDLNQISAERLIR